MQLPTKSTPPGTVDPRRLLLYGAPKVGKTTVLAQLPNCLILDFEHGTDFVDALKITVENTNHLAEIATELRTQKAPYDYVAFDTISAMEDWAEALATKRYKESGVGKTFDGNSVLELPHGNGYLWLRLAFTEMMAQFDGGIRRAIFVAHLRDKYLQKDGVEVSVKDLELTGKIKAMTAAAADSVGYLYRGPDNKLKISFATNENVLCGSRSPHLKGGVFEFDWNLIYKEPAKPIPNIK